MINKRIVFLFRVSFSLSMGIDMFMAHSKYHLNSAPLFYQLMFLCRMDTLKKHHPSWALEKPQEIKSIAQRLEEKIYTTTTSQVCIFDPLMLVLCACVLFTFFIVLIVTTILYETVAYMKVHSRYIESFS